MLTWLKHNGPFIGALAGTVVAVVAVLQIVVVGPMNSRFDDLRSDVNSRFDAADQRFNDLRSDVNSRFDAVDRRFNDLRAEMSQRFDAVDQRFAAVDQRFNDFRAEMSQRFDAVDQRLDRLGNDFSELRALSDRVSNNEGQIDFLMQQLQTVDAPTP